MKTWKHGIFGIIALIALTFIACNDPDPKPDPILCKCDPKEHYLPCTCGGTDCACAVKPRGFIEEMAGFQPSGIQIPIYQSIGVTDEQAETALANIIAGYNGVSNVNKGKLGGKLAEIWIVAGEYSTCTPDGIVRIGINIPYSVRDVFVVAIPVVEQQSITITFNSNGGTAVESQTIIAGEKITAPQNVTKQGYTLEGWYSDANFQYKMDFNQQFTFDTTLHAKWIEN
jgi:uncharacterized repeat protein (TIGR02543 family)